MSGYAHCDKCHKTMAPHEGGHVACVEKRVLQDLKDMATRMHLLGLSHDEAEVIYEFLGRYERDRAA